MVPTYATDKKYVMSRRIYQSFYSEWELIDLGRAHWKRGGFPMLDEVHPANTGGLRKTILIAKELQRLLGGP